KTLYFAAQLVSLPNEVTQVFPDTVSRVITHFRAVPHVHTTVGTRFCRPHIFLRNIHHAPNIDLHAPGFSVVKLHRRPLQIRQRPSPPFAKLDQRLPAKLGAPLQSQIPQRWHGGQRSHPPIQRPPREPDAPRHPQVRKPPHRARPRGVALGRCCSRDSVALFRRSERSRRHRRLRRVRQRAAQLAKARVRHHAAARKIQVRQPRQPAHQPPHHRRLHLGFTTRAAKPVVVVVVVVVPARHRSPPPPRAPRRRWPASTPAPAPAAQPVAHTRPPPGDDGPAHCRQHPRVRQVQPLQPRARIGQSQQQLGGEPAVARQPQVDQPGRRRQHAQQKASLRGCRRRRRRRRTSPPAGSPPPAAPRCRARAPNVVGSAADRVRVRARVPQLRRVELALPSDFPLLLLPLPSPAVVAAAAAGVKELPLVQRRCRRRRPRRPRSTTSRQRQRRRRRVQRGGSRHPVDFAHRAQPGFKCAQPGGADAQERADGEVKGGHGGRLYPPRQRIGSRRRRSGRRAITRWPRRLRGVIGAERGQGGAAERTSCGVGAGAHGGGGGGRVRVGDDAVGEEGDAEAGPKGRVERRGAPGAAHLAGGYEVAEAEVGKDFLDDLAGQRLPQSDDRAVVVVGAASPPCKGVRRRGARRGSRQLVPSALFVIVDALRTGPVPLFSRH
ncbi:hypothetical protein DFJ73DRAFT_897540, partial [Zopfochytrium polystomum]